MSIMQLYNSQIIHGQINEFALQSDIVFNLIDFELIQLLICIIQKMRRQKSTDVRKAVSKSISKAKKNKHAHTQELEQRQKRTDQEMFKTHHESHAKQLAAVLAQLDEHRLHQKVEQMQMLADRMLSHEQCKRFEEFTRILVQEEQIHSLIELSMKENNQEKLRQQSEYMRRIQEKKKQFLTKDSHNTTQNIIMNSGVFTNELIARQTSPKMKAQMIGFSDFNKKTIKKQSDQVVELKNELKNKDLVIRRLFQRIELLEMSNNKFDRQKSFKENMECINLRYLQSQRKNMRMAKQVENIENKREEAISEMKQQYILNFENVKTEYNKLLQDYKKLEQKYALQNEELKHNYQELEEQFNFSVEEKFEWERKYNKVLKENNVQQQRITELKNKISEFLKEEVPEMREVVRITQNKLREFRQFIRTLIAEQIQEFCSTFIKRSEQQITQYKEIIDQRTKECQDLYVQVKDQSEREKGFVETIAQKTKQCQNLQAQARAHSEKQKNHLEQIVQKTKMCEKLLKMTEIFELNIAKMINQHTEYRKSVENNRKQRKSRLCLMPNTLQYSLLPTYIERHYSIHNFQILHFKGCSAKNNMCTQTAQKKSNLRLKSLQCNVFFEFKNQNQTQQSGVQTQSQQKNLSIEMGCQTNHQKLQICCVQTDSISTKQVHTQSTLPQKISTHTQMYHIKQFEKQSVMGFAFQGEKIQKRPVQNFTFCNTVQLQFLTQLDIESTEVQTQPQEYEPQQTYQGFKLIEQQQFNTNAQNDMLRMLQDAEDCVIVPDIAILRQQIAAYRQQVDRLKNVIRQHQKQKQEENVFNFRL